MNEKINISHLSYSSISRYLKCSAMFKAYVTEKKPLPTEAQLAGRDRHADIEEHLKAGTIEKSSLGPRLKNFCSRIIMPVTAVESEFSLDYITTNIVGRIDAYSVHGKQATIADFKGYPGDHIDELQLQIYALAVKAKHPEVEVIHAAFAYVPPDYYELKTYFADDLVRLSTIIAEAVDRIAVEEKFEPAPGPHCTRCEYVGSCPAAKNFAIPEKLTSSNVSTMADNLYALEALVDKAKAGIKDYMIENGLESLPAGTDGRYYLSTSTALRVGKMKSEKEKAGAEKLLELGTAEKPSRKRATKNAVNASEAPVASSSSAPVSEDTMSDPDVTAVNNIIAFEIQQEKSERVKMSELVDLLKQRGRLPKDATSADGSQLIRKLIGVPFLTATENQRRELRDRLLSESAA
jgi:CRISPR/Cas system-associated exonuclease Cas4 (RecB family)